MSKKGENIYKRKDGRWEGRYKKGVDAGGKTLYGYCYDKTYRDVKEKLEILKTRQNDPQNKDIPNRKKLFGAYCDEWLLYNKSRVKESTMAKYTAAIEKYIKPAFGNILPGYITNEAVLEFSNQLISVNNLSTKTVKDLLTIMKSVFKYISRFQKVVYLIDFTVPKQGAKEIRVLSGSEQQKLIDYLTYDIDRFKFGILFALMTGLRIGEICALRNGDISLTEKTVTVRKTMQRIKNLDDDGPKTKIIFSSPKSDFSARIVPLTNAAVNLCKSQIGDSSPNAFLLTGSETKFIEPRVLQYRIKKYGAECEIENLHFHALRHTFATRCVEVGFEIKTLSEVLGHSTPRFTLERYVHSSLDFKRQNMTKLETIGL